MGHNPAGYGREDAEKALEHLLIAYHFLAKTPPKKRVFSPIEQAMQPMLKAKMDFETICAFVATQISQGCLTGEWK